MKINEINQPSVNALFESLMGADDQPFSENTVRLIAESVSNTNNGKQISMSVQQALNWLDNL